MILRPSILDNSVFTNDFAESTRIENYPDTLIAPVNIPALSTVPEPSEINPEIIPTPLEPSVLINTVTLGSPSPGVKLRSTVERKELKVPARGSYFTPPVLADERRRNKGFKIPAVPRLKLFEPNPVSSSDKEKGKKPLSGVQIKKGEKRKNPEPTTFYPPFTVPILTGLKGLLEKTVVMDSKRTKKDRGNFEDFLGQINEAYGTAEYGNIQNMTLRQLQEQFREANQDSSSTSNSDDSDIEREALRAKTERYARTIPSTGNTGGPSSSANTVGTGTGGGIETADPPPENSVPTNGQGQGNSEPKPSTNWRQNDHESGSDS